MHQLKSGLLIGEMIHYASPHFKIAFIKAIMWLWIVLISYIQVSLSNKCIKWGGSFDVPIEGDNIPLSCKLPTGKPVCCEATDEVSQYGITSRGVGNSYYNLIEENGKIMNQNMDTCILTKSYHSSPQELRDLEMSMKLQKTSDFEQRFTQLMDYVTLPETIKNSTRWLNRVTYHMQHPALSTFDGKHHEDDIEFLSYFKIIKSCKNSGISSWIEWIEPVSITARHPFGFGRCRPAVAYHKNKTIEGNNIRSGHRRASVHRSNVDYVLLQNGVNLYHQHHDHQGVLHHTTSTVIHRSQGLNAFNSTSYTSSYSPTKLVTNTPARQPRAFMLDSGSSTFDSSLVWFTCGYSQSKISFDQVYAWELTLLEPQDYWSRVPAKWIPHWHFYNMPISSDGSAHNSPVRQIKSLATPQDFVAYKLDIDTPSVEMPIALELLKDEAFQSLVDEFFFELHFQCEVMTSCGWGKRVPSESHGLILDRPHVLKFFIELRQSGIRAHIWP